MELFEKMMQLWLHVYEIGWRDGFRIGACVGALLAVTIYVIMRLREK